MMERDIGLVRELNTKMAKKTWRLRTLVQSPQKMKGGRGN